MLLVREMFPVVLFAGLLVIERVGTLVEAMRVTFAEVGDDNFPSFEDLSAAAAVDFAAVDRVLGVFDRGVLLAC